MKTSQEYLKDNWLERYAGELSRIEDIRAAKRELAEKLDRPSVDSFKDPINALQNESHCEVDFSSEYCCFGKTGTGINDSETVKVALEALIPWRKGPFRYYDHVIDTEWRSFMKWDRIAPVLPPVDRLKICDIGCNNGYYMYRLLSLGQPELLWGLDPMIRYYFYFKMNQHFYRNPALHFDILGVEHMDLMPDFFDLVLFMGVIYHRRNPVETLQKVAVSMKSGATLIMESSGIPGEDPLCLFPEERYLKAPGYWFLPTASALSNMLKRTGFKDIEIFHSHKLEFDEQRQTPWAPYQSLEHFLDPENPDRTVEGYPAPIRIYIKAIRK